MIAAAIIYASDRVVMYLLMSSTCSHLYNKYLCLLHCIGAQHAFVQPLCMQITLICASRIVSFVLH